MTLPQQSEHLRGMVEAATVPAEDPVFGELLLRRLARTARLRDEETAAHMQRMSRSCASIARRLGFSDSDCERVRAASLLHDVGKVGIPDAVLRKPGRLTDAERRLMEHHTRYGHEILSGSGNDLVELAATIALSHHERFDGGGYPRRLRGQEIPLPGRIAALADVFDALTNDRIYRPAFSVEEATDMMASERGSQFDPTVFDAFIDARAEIVEIGRLSPDEPAYTANSPLNETEDATPTRVVIVEDHEAIGRGLELLLRREGMEVAGTASNLADGRALLEQVHPDVLIVDVDLGVESGLQLLGNAERAGARVLLYTGRADLELLAVAAQAGVLGLATKAGSPVELIRAVKAVAAGREYRDHRLAPA
jgi:response regulator RpfG family c-di-GMP phosphodiesterase